MTDTNTAREQLLDVISFTECANSGTTPDALLTAYRNEVIVDLCYGDARDVLGSHRDQVLAEAAELIRAHRGDINTDSPWWDTRDRDTAIRLLLAARTTTAQEQQ